MRKAKPKKRVILPDPVFGDQKVTKFVNHLMYDGKKNTSYEIFYTALETVKTKLPNEEKTALEIWKKALDNVTSKEVSQLLNYLHITKYPLGLLVNFGHEDNLEWKRYANF